MYRCTLHTFKGLQPRQTKHGGERCKFREVGPGHTRDMLQRAQPGLKSESKQGKAGPSACQTGKISPLGPSERLAREQPAGYVLYSVRSWQQLGSQRPGRLLCGSLKPCKLSYVDVPTLMRPTELCKPGWLATSTRGPVSRHGQS